MTQPSPDPRDLAAERRIRLWSVAIPALGGVVVAGIALIGTLAATDSKIVPQGEPGPTIERTVTVAPTATATATVTVTVDASGETTGPTEVPTPSETALDTNWTTTAGAYLKKYGLVVAFDCPEAGIIQRIYGGPVYHYNSSVCTAAVQDGRIDVEKGGRVIVQIREGKKEYPISRRNGITSERAGTASTSFEFLPRK